MFDRSRGFLVLLSSLFLILFMLLSLLAEPTQIYRFLRTRNAVQVSFKDETCSNVETLINFSSPVNDYITVLHDVI
jgi:hypothetical protein